MKAPLISVALPTHNRAGTLGRAVESALAQSHARLEVVISDNGSSDGTRAICEELSERDARVRYVRHPVNRGMAANFNSALAHCRGEYLMMLADDDWLDRDYVERCLEVLRARPECAVACGVTRFLSEAGPEGEGKTLDLSQRSPWRRVWAFYAQVYDDSAVYGLMPRGTYEQLPPFREVFATDWHLGASMAFLGTVARVEGTYLNRSLGGASMASQTGDDERKQLQRQRTGHPIRDLVRFTFFDITRWSPVYKTLPPWRRVALALASVLTFSRYAYPYVPWVYHASLGLARSFLRRLYRGLRRGHRRLRKKARTRLRQLRLLSRARLRRLFALAFAGSCAGSEARRTSLRRLRGKGP